MWWDDDYKIAMTGFFKYFFVVIVRFIRQYYNAYKIYKLYGVVLDSYSIITRYDSIVIGNNFSIGNGCRLYCQDPENNSSLVIGDNVSLNDNVMINADCGGVIRIGNNVLIGPGSIFRAANHIFENTTVPIKSQGHLPGKIIIGDNVWVGAGVIVLPDVAIGASSVIGAGSVVTKDIPAGSVAVGVPAKVIKNIAK
jgi:galactoside O-acetyltransferase